MLYKQKIVRRW